MATRKSQILSKIPTSGGDPISIRNKSIIFDVTISPGKGEILSTASCCNPMIKKLHQLYEGS